MEELRQQLKQRRNLRSVGDSVSQQYLSVFCVSGSVLNALDNLTFITNLWDQYFYC